MTEDRRAHDRLDSLELRHETVEKSLKEIADNTSELVALFKGIKGFRTLVIWGAPLVATIIALIAYIREWK